MGRTSNSCFKIITCAGNPAEKEDLGVTESKTSTDKRGWSFRKRSARHRVLNNIAITEFSSGENKDIIVTNSNDSRSLPNANIPEKVTLPQYTSEVCHPVAVEQKLDPPETPKHCDDSDSNLEESVATVIQSSIRGQLAKSDYCRLKNVIRLQSVIRGHLVRREAAGALRCVQAIVKIQTLVRSRQCLDHSKDSMQFTHGKAIHSSTRKILYSRFANQLLESTPNPKPIPANCVSPRTDSAWKWLERWTSATLQSSQSPKVENTKAIEKTEEKVKSDISDINILVQIPVLPEEPNLNFTSEKAADSPIFYGPLVTDTEGFEFQIPPTIDTEENISFPVKEESEISQPMNEGFLSYQSPIESELISQLAPISSSNKPVVNKQNTDCTIEGVITDKIDGESKKSILGPRKASNPAFTAAQMKFEELSSSTASSRLTSSNNDVTSESKSNTHSSYVNSITKTKNFNLTDISPLDETKNQAGGSECGTELSVTSTLDSPDLYEVDTHNFADETNPLHTRDSEQNDIVFEKIDSMTKSLPNSCESVLNDYFNDCVNDSTHEQQQPVKQSISDIPIHPVGNNNDHQQYKSSPEGSPKSHITVPESHGTPSSQVSINARRVKSNSSMPNNKRSLPLGKKSLSSAQSENSTPRKDLSKEPKSVKRRSSFGSAKTETVDQEHKDNMSNSVPSYMQATESVKAKLNYSPKSSPDVHDNDVHIKKRHSLPAGNGMQISPRIQRSMSQVPPGAKGSNKHSPHKQIERKWQR